MKNGLEIEYVGLRSYEDVLHLQETHFKKLIEEKTNFGNSTSPSKLILCQHNAVYTLGKNGEEANLLPLAKQSGAEFFHTDRGGDITFHGPGQLVGYPILDLESLSLGLAQYIENLEQVIIEVVKDFGIDGKRLSSASGVWLDVNNAARTRKICALGIKSSRFVTMHGFAFNINTDLKYFDYINPCGFTDKGVTSMQKELGEKLDFELIMASLIDKFQDVFKIESAEVIQL